MSIIASSNPTLIAVAHHCAHRASGDTRTIVVVVVDVVVVDVVVDVVVVVLIGVLIAFAGNAMIAHPTINATTK